MKKKNVKKKEEKKIPIEKALKKYDVLISRLHLSWFAFMYLLANHSKSFSAAFSKDVLIFRGVSPDTKECIVGILISSIIIKRSHIKMLNNKGPKIDPRGTPSKISSQEL